MPKLKAIYWDDRTLFSKEKFEEYTLILADLIKNWDPVKYDGTAFKLLSYFEEMKKVLAVLNDEFGVEKDIDDIISKSDICSFVPVSDEMNGMSVWATDRWGVAYIVEGGEMKTMNIKDMILS